MPTAAPVLEDEWRRRTGIEPADAFVTRPTALKAAAGTSRQTPPPRPYGVSPYDDKVLAARNQFSDDGRAGNLARDEQAT